MYLDTNGNVTVGVGHILATGAAAESLAFVRKAGAQPTTPNEKRGEWALMKQQAPGMVASRYDEFATLTLPQGPVDAALQADLQACELELRRTFDGFGSLPGEAQEGVMDMDFNLGLPKFLTFTRFVAAVRTRDWETAGVECHRIGIPQDRNEEIRNLFFSAYTRIIEGHWEGTAADLEGNAVQLGITVRMSGPGYAGDMTTRDREGEQSNAALSQIQLLPGRRVKFTGDDDLDFAGDVSPDQLRITGQIFDEGTLGGSFQVLRR
jgi:GH24 family phage-related lysozyme (muramidase)